MAILKCKMCGGTLTAIDNKTVIECEYCGATQTLPKTDNEDFRYLFDRANDLRRSNEFDKAEEMYEEIISITDSEAEAYWGAILSKYGIEYVEDPATGKRIPTCHRASFEAIVADDYYKKALERADALQRAVYEEEAKRIDEIQKEILAISSQEEPYDVFICYKETDEFGKRTQDSVIANDIYHQLTQEGYKVFYAAITLEDKLGSAYEPIIFAALTSSKVMLAIGTKPEYFNAVWVKNEWSRFLKMMKKDRSKMLIPCYRDMEAYALPEQFAHLQAQDMGKIGFISDIVRGIGKVVKKNAPVAESAIIQSVPQATTPAPSSVLKRCHILIEDGEFDKARELCEDYLNDYPEDGDAYVVLLLCELKVSLDSLKKSKFLLLDQSKHYTKIQRYANEEIKALVESLNEKYYENQLQKALTIINDEASSLRSLRSALTTLQPLVDREYKNSQEIFNDLYERINSRTAAVKKLDKADYTFKYGNYQSFSLFSEGYVIAGNGSASGFKSFYFEDITLIETSRDLTSGKVVIHGYERNNSAVLPTFVLLMCEKADIEKVKEGLKDLINRISLVGNTECKIDIEFNFEDDGTDYSEVFAFSTNVDTFTLKSDRVIFANGQFSHGIESIDYKDIIYAEVLPFMQALKMRLYTNTLYYDSCLVDKSDEERLISFVEILKDSVKKVNTSYSDKKPYNIKQKTGCYVATCVYGSYDCPEVWTLRRYRDDTLGSTWYGRLFIRTYYAISPTLVKWFGHTRWFKRMWRGKLDRMVKRLQDSGVESTPYQDKSW
ncbi:MAG: toll/interleukin-1 receptor domain-containing protein [Clostridia bacterium]|nr:toll/interleukin-1 receptor domain-containing protein [Clostridia bacterium]